MEGTKIVLMCVAGAVLYGIAHDLVTASVCVEYFTEFHPDVFHTGSPVLLALGWGFIATWWAGAFIGGALAIAARVGPMPKLGWRKLRSPVVLVFLVMAVG